MRKLLICPSDRTGVPFLSQHVPLANAPLLGLSLLEYWLSALSISGIKKVLILAHDRPEFALEVTGEGERWGLEATILNESRELSAAEALLKYATEVDGVPAEEAISVLDHFPGAPDRPLFGNYQQWFEAIRTWMPSALMPDRVGVNEALPGVWKGCHAHVSPLAQLNSPCWIGQHVFVGANAIVGPGAILEDGSFVEPGAELAEPGSDLLHHHPARRSSSFVCSPPPSPQADARLVQKALGFVRTQQRGRGNVLEAPAAA